MIPEIHVRPATDADADAIAQVHARAFGRPEEAEIVAALHHAGAVTLSLVAEQAGEIVGHVLFSPVRIATAEGDVEAVGLAPLAVRPEHQRRGIGQLLTRVGLAALREAGHGGVVVLGHPAYYPKLGFRPAAGFGLRWEHDCDPAAFMAQPLRPDGLPEHGGVVRYRPELGGSAW